MTHLNGKVIKSVDVSEPYGDMVEIHFEDGTWLVIGTQDSALNRVPLDFQYVDPK